MGFKDKFQKNLGDKRKMLRYRYEASKTIFIVMTYLFFLFFFFSAAGYYEDTFSQLVTPSYIITLLSFGLFSYFYTAEHSANKTLSYVVAGICFIAVVGGCVLIFI